MVVGFRTTYAISAYHHQCCEFKSCSWWGVLNTTLCDKVFWWLATDLWFSPGTAVSSSNESDRHDITEIVLKEALNTISLMKIFYLLCRFWDIFASIPREQKTQDVHERGSLRLIKVITYGLLFILLFASLVFQKIGLMLLVNKKERNFTISDSDVTETDIRKVKYIWSKINLYCYPLIMIFRSREVLLSLCVHGLRLISRSLFSTNHWPGTNFIT
jgi:hypothetical protein